MVTKSDVFELLKKFGIKPDDKVTIHTSLRAIGQIEGGADGLIDAFCEYLCDGLLIIPAHTWANVNKDNPFYDVKATPPCIGALPKIAVARKDGVRSLHPTHSVVAFGKGAEEFVKGEEKAITPAPVWSCLSRLYEENGKVLLIGVGHEKNTYLHTIDEVLDIPERIDPEAFVVTIKDYNGNLIITPPHHPHVVLKGYEYDCISEYYPHYKEAFDYAGAVTYGKLGNALVYCCDAKKMTDTAKTIWQRSNGTFDIMKEIPKEYYI